MRKAVLSLPLSLSLAAGGLAQEPTGPTGQKSDAPLTLLRLFEIRGRCVDASSGKAVAGCHVRLSGQARSGSNGNKWRNPDRVKTREDGSFSVFFDPPPSYRFALDIRHPAYVPLSGRFSRLNRGGVVDLGDVELPKGSRVVGRIVDTAGRPRAGARIYLRIKSRTRYGRQRLQPRLYYLEHSKKDGRIEFRNRIPPGAWTVSLSREHRLERPRELVVRPNVEIASLDIVVKADVPTLSGIVVDETGSPVPHLLLGCEPRAGRALTRDDGTFVLYRREGDPEGPLRLVSRQRGGYEDIADGRSFAWDTKDIRLVVRRGQSVQVRVVEASSGRPVENYALRCFPDGGFLSSGDSRLQHAGRHESGIVWVTGVRMGKHLLIIEPEEQRLAPSGLVSFVMKESGAPEILVKLREPVRRRLRVVDPERRAVAGTRVELLRPLGEAALALWTPVVERQRIRGFIGTERALLLQRGRTDGAGEIVLMAAPEQGLGLRILGPGHQPVVRSCVSLDSSEPLVVMVPRGAVLTGRIEPFHLIRKFLPPAMVLERLEEHGVEEGRSPYRPGVRLVRAGSSRDTYPPGFTSNFNLHPDGGFEIRGIPPGTWQVHLSYFTAGGGSGNRGSWSRQLLTTVEDLEEGELRKLVLNAKDLGHGTLEGRIMVDGKPMANGPLQVRGTRPDGKGGTTPVHAPAGLRTDDSGSFTVRLRPGTYTIAVQLKSGEAGHARWIPSRDSIPVHAAQVSLHEFRILHQILEVKICESDGKTPVAKREFFVQAKGYFSTTGIKTDAIGWLVVDPVPPGPIWLSTWPPGLAKLSKKDPDLYRRAVLRLGPIRIPARKKRVIHELSMPEERRQLR